MAAPVLPQAIRYAGRGLASTALGRAPLFLTVFVTARCGLACGHCLYARRRRRADARDELTLDEFRRFAARVPAFPKLLLTGGEPLLREDLPGIAAAFHDLAGVRQITVATAAQEPARALALVEDLLPARPGLALEVQCSLDGVGAAHDRIRGPGAFDRLVATARALLDAAPRHPGLEVRFNFTFSAATQAGFEETLRFVDEEMAPAKLDMVLVRPPVSDPAWIDGVDLDAYRAAAALLQEREVRRAGSSPLRRALAERVRAERAIVASHHQGRRALDRCRAGTLIGVVDETGEVRPCEMLDVSFGNLRDVDFDFRALWRGSAARAHRRAIARSRCFCTFESAVRASATFRPRTAVELALGALGAWPRRAE